MENCPFVSFCTLGAPRRPRRMLLPQFWSSITGDYVQKSRTYLPSHRHIIWISSFGAHRFSDFMLGVYMLAVEIIKGGIESGTPDFELHAIPVGHKLNLIWNLDTHALQKISDQRKFNRVCEVCLFICCTKEVTLTLRICTFWCI